MIAGATSAHYRYDRSSLLCATAYNASVNDCTTTQTDSTLTLMSYDPAQRIQTIRHKQGAALIGQYDYRYDAHGNRIEQVLDQGHQTATTTYEYDPNDRLTAVHYPDQSTTYTYDAAYNRLTEHSLKTDGSPLLERYYAYDNRNQLLQIEDRTSGLMTTYAYDANGNRIQRSEGAEIQSYQFDIRNQIREIKLGGSSVWQFLYDYQGLRIRKTTPAATTRTVYDDQSVLLQTDADGNTLAKYTYGSDHLFSLTHHSQPPQFYLFDALGSVVALAKLDGALQARYDYDAWGNARPNAAGESANIFGFTGHEKDDESGLYYFKSRFYDPDIGQFLSQDAFEGMADTPPSLHQYLYAYANPTVFVDLDGNKSIFGAIANRLDSAIDFLNERSEFAGGGVEAAAIGLGRLAVRTGKGVLDAADIASNVALNQVFDDPDIQGELAQTRLSTSNAIDFAANADKIAATRSAHQAAVMRTTDAFEGDTAAIADVAEGISAAVTTGFGLRALAPRKRVAQLEEKKDGPDSIAEPQIPGENIAAEALGADLPILNVQTNDKVVTASAEALANVRGDVIIKTDQLNILQNGDTLTIVAHGSPNSVGGMSASELASLLQQNNFSGKTIELVACKTGCSVYAQELANLTGANVSAPIGNINVLKGIYGVPQVRDSATGILRPPGELITTVKPKP